MSQPKVSILTTCYNRALFLGEAITSVLSQTFEDFEYIIVDDCSTDGSIEIANRFANRDQRIKVYKNETNLGDYPNRNRAASYATGEYLKYIDSDDILFPHTIDVMVRCMDSFPDAGIGLSAAYIQEARYPICLTPTDAFHFNFTKTDIFGRAPGSAIIRRSAFEAQKGFSGLRQIGDFECWMKLACYYPLVVMPRDLYWARTHADQEQHYDDVQTKHEMKVKVLNALKDSAICPIDLQPYIRELEVQYHKGKNRMKLKQFVSLHDNLYRTITLLRSKLKSY